MNNHPRPPSRFGLAPVESLTLIQHNSLSSWDVFLSLFSSFTEVPLVDIVLLQDPPVSRGFLSFFAGFQSFAPPIAKPRVACYVSQRFLLQVSALPFVSPDTKDFMALNIFTP